MSCLLAEYEIKTKSYKVQMISALSLFYLRAYPILCCFLPPYYKIMTKGQESIHLPEMNSQQVLVLHLCPLQKSSTQKAGGIYKNMIQEHFRIPKYLDIQVPKIQQMLFIGYSHVLKHGQHAGKLLLFVQIEVNREKILNNNRSCIMKTSLLLLLISYKLIFKFSHKRDSKANNFSDFSYPEK